MMFVDRGGGGGGGGLVVFLVISQSIMEQLVCYPAKTPE